MGKYNLKDFFINNRSGLFWSYLTLFILGAFIGAIKKFPKIDLYLSLLMGLPLMFLMSYGVYCFTGGNK